MVKVAAQCRYREKFNNTANRDGTLTVSRSRIRIEPLGTKNRSLRLRITPFTAIPGCRAVQKRITFGLNWNPLKPKQTLSRAEHAHAHAHAPCGPGAVPPGASSSLRGQDRFIQDRRLLILVPNINPCSYSLYREEGEFHMEHILKALNWGTS
jgi:hypothetical protein